MRQQPPSLAFFTGNEKHLFRDFRRASSLLNHQNLKKRIRRWSVGVSKCEAAKEARRVAIDAEWLNGATTKVKNVVATSGWEVFDDFDWKKWVSTLY
jgi:hypothetical protein